VEYHLSNAAAYNPALQSGLFVSGFNGPSDLLERCREYLKGYHGSDLWIAEKMLDALKDI
jgi:hypothetical protein